MVYLLAGCNVIDMIAEGDKEVEEEGSSAVVHFELHCAAPLKGIAGADDEREVMGAEFGVGVRSICICISSRRQNSAALDSRFLSGRHVSLGRAMSCGTIKLTKTLLSKGKLLQLGQAIALSSAVDDGIFEQVTLNAPKIDCALYPGPVLISRWLELPRVATLIVRHSRKVVSLVEVLEHGAKNLGLLVWQSDALGRRVHVCVSQGMGEERAGAEDVFVGCKEPLFGANDECDNV